MNEDIPQLLTLSDQIPDLAVFCFRIQVCLTDYPLVSECYGARPFQCATLFSNNWNVNHLQKKERFQ